MPRPIHSLVVIDDSIVFLPMIASDCRLRLTVPAACGSAHRAWEHGRLARVCNTRERASRLGARASRPRVQYSVSMPMPDDEDGAYMEIGNQIRCTEPAVGLMEIEN